MSFADAEARATASAMSRLANATATPDVGPDIPVIFDSTTLAAMGGEITTTGPVAHALSADVAAYVCNSTTLTINGVGYMVRDKQPDGVGMTLLILERT